MGQSGDALKLQRKQIRSRAAAVSARQKPQENSLGAFQRVPSVRSPLAWDVPTSLHVVPASPLVPFVIPVQTSATCATYLDGSLNPFRLPRTNHEDGHDHAVPRDENLVSAIDLEASDSFSESPAGRLVISRGYYAIPSDHRGFRSDPFNCIPARGSEHLSDVLDYCTFPT